MSNVYQKLVPTFAPPWFCEENGLVLLQALGAELDATADQVMQGRLQSFVFAGGADAARTGAARLADGRLIECEPLALSVHAEQRGMTLYPTDTTLARRVRLSQWKPLHRRRATHRGELEHVRPYFAAAAAYPVLRAAHRSGSGIVVWHEMNAAGRYSVERATSDNFNFDGQTTKRSRWWLFYEMRGTGYTSPNVYNDGHTWNDGARYDIGDAVPITSSIALDLIAMARDWKASHSWLAGVALVWKAGGLDVTAAPAQDAAGWWTLPGAGEWANPVGRPPYVEFIYENPG